MKKIKYLLVSTLLVSGICCSLAYADDNNDYTEKQMKKFVQQQNFDIANPSYINYVGNLVFSNNNPYDYNENLKGINYYVALNEKFYGTSHPNTAYAYIARAEFYKNYLLIENALNDLRKADEIYQKNKADIELANTLNIAYFCYYLQIEEPTKAIAYLNKIDSKIFNKDSFKNEYQNYLYLYNQLKDEKAVITYYDKLEKEILKTNPDAGEELFFFYLSKAGWYKSLENFQDCEKNVEKAEKLLTQLKDENKNLLINLNKFKIMYLNSKLDLESEAPILSETEELIKKYGNIVDKENINQYYIDYYREKKEYDKLPKYFKVVENLYKEYPVNALMTYSSFKEKQIDAYKEQRNIEKAEEILNSAIEQYEAYKDLVPFFYAKLLKRDYEIKKDKGEFKEAKCSLDKALEYFKKSQPEDSYEYVDLYKNYADLSQIYDNKTILAYYQKALNINKSHIKGINIDLADIYAGIAKNLQSAEEVLAYEDKAIEIRKQCYGANHAKVYEELLNKYHIYENLGLQADADKLLAEINDAVESKSIKGYTTLLVDYPLSIINAYKALEKQDYQNAISISDKSLSYAKTDENKEEVYRLKYEIYSASGNKLKAQKYKKLANIE